MLNALRTAAVAALFLTAGCTVQVQKDTTFRGEAPALAAVVGPKIALRTSVVDADGAAIATETDGFEAMLADAVQKAGVEPTFGQATPGQPSLAVELRRRGEKFAWVKSGGLNAQKLIPFVGHFATSPYVISIDYEVRATYRDGIGTEKFGSIDVRKTEEVEVRKANPAWVQELADMLQQRYDQSQSEAVGQVLRMMAGSI